MPAKTFSIQPYSDAGSGEKILVYGKTGNGKTTLAAMLPNAVFLAFDDGVRKIHNPLTGKVVNSIPNVSSFQDVRDALHQPNLFPEKSVIVLDTITKLEALAEPYIFDNYPSPKGGRASHMRAYGWDGPSHRLDIMRLLMADLDPLVSSGRHVLLLAQQSQITIAHSAGMDYLEDGPKLEHTKQYSSRMEVCEWADHILRIGYADFEVRADNDKARVGKATGDMTRAVFSGGAAHYLAKTRPIGGKTLPPLISFAAKNDDSLWQMMFHGAIPSETV